MGDLSLSIAPRLKLRRSERTRIAHLLNRVLKADPVGARYDSAPAAEMYKRLVKAVHPGDYPSLIALSRWADDLYRGEVYSFESLVDRAYATRDAQNVARLLSTRPGVFAPSWCAPWMLSKRPATALIPRRALASRSSLTRLPPWRRAFPHPSWCRFATW